MDLAHALVNLSLSELPLVEVPSSRRAPPDSHVWVVSPSADFHIKGANGVVVDDAIGIVPREVYLYPAPDEAEQCQCYNCVDQYGYRTFNKYQLGAIDRVHTWGADIPFRRCRHLPGPACAKHVAADDTSTPAPVPPLAMVVVAVGTRDEIAAHFAVAKALAAVGHTIRFATYKAHAEFLYTERRHCEPAVAARLSFFALSDPLDIAHGRVAAQALLTLHPPSLQGGAAAVRTLFEDVCDACRVEGGVFDVIVVAPPLVALVTHIAETIPSCVVVALSLLPWVATRVIPSPFVGVGSDGWPVVTPTMTKYAQRTLAKNGGGGVRRRGGGRSRSRSRSRSRGRRRGRSSSRDGGRKGRRGSRSRSRSRRRRRGGRDSRSRSRSRSHRKSDVIDAAIDVEDRGAGAAEGGAGVRGGDIGGVDVRQSYSLVDNLQWLATAHTLEEIRRNTLGLGPSGECDGARCRRIRVPFVYLTSSHLIPPPTDAGDHTTATGMAYLPFVSPRHLDTPSDCPTALSDVLASRSSIAYIDLPTAFTNAQFVDPAVAFKAIVSACCAFAPRHAPFAAPSAAFGSRGGAAVGAGGLKGWGGGLSDSSDDDGSSSGSEDQARTTLGASLAASRSGRGRQRRGGEKVREDKIESLVEGFGGGRSGRGGKGKGRRRGSRSSRRGHRSRSRGRSRSRSHSRRRRERETAHGREREREGDGSDRHVFGEPGGGGALDALIFDMSFAPEVAATLPIVATRGGGAGVKGEAVTLVAVGDASSDAYSAAVPMLATLPDGRAVSVLILRKEVSRPWVLQHRNVRLVIHSGDYGSSVDALMSGTPSVAVTHHRYNEWWADTLKTPRVALRDASAAAMGDAIQAALSSHHIAATESLGRKVGRQAVGTLRRVVASIHRLLPLTTDGEWVCTTFEYQCLRPTTRQWVAASDAQLLTWADITCSIPTPRESFTDGGLEGHVWQWEGEWSVATDDTTDEDGWTYAAGSTAQHYYHSSTACPGNATIRRRRWIRVKVPQGVYVGVDSRGEHLAEGISGLSIRKVGRAPPSYVRSGILADLSPDLSRRRAGGWRGGDASAAPHVSVTLSGIPFALEQQRLSRGHDMGAQTPSQRARDGGGPRGWVEEALDGEVIGPARLTERGTDTAGGPYGWSGRGRRGGAYSDTTDSWSTATSDDGRGGRGGYGRRDGKRVGGEMATEPAPTPRAPDPPPQLEPTVAVSVEASRHDSPYGPFGPYPTDAAPSLPPPLGGGRGARLKPAPLTVPPPSTRTFRYAPYAAAAAQSHATQSLAMGGSGGEGGGYGGRRGGAAEAWVERVLGTAPPALRQGSWFWKLDPHRHEAVKRYAFVVEDGVAVGAGYAGPALVWTAEEVPITRDPRTGVTRVPPGVLKGCLPLDRAVTAHMEVIDPAVLHERWPTDLVRCEVGDVVVVCYCEALWSVWKCSSVSPLGFYVCPSLVECTFIRRSSCAGYSRVEYTQLSWCSLSLVHLCSHTSLMRVRVRLQDSTL